MTMDDIVVARTYVRDASPAVWCGALELNGLSLLVPPSKRDGWGVSIRSGQTDWSLKVVEARDTLFWS